MIDDDDHGDVGGYGKGKTRHYGSSVDSSGDISANWGLPVQHPTAAARRVVCRIAERGTLTGAWALRGGGGVEKPLLSFALAVHRQHPAHIH